MLLQKFQLLKHWFRPTTVPVSLADLFSLNISHISSETDRENSSANIDPSRSMLSRGLSALLV